MIIGCPKEIKAQEGRVALTPAGAKALVRDGSEVLVEKGAGLGAGFPDTEYKAAGAKILPTADEVWAASNLIVKVKEPLESEYRFLREGLIIFAYLHLAGDKPLTEALLAQKVTALAYETYVDEDGAIPMLDCMSEIAGKLAILEGSRCLYAADGGSGLLLPKVTASRPVRVAVIGAGHAGISAALMAESLGARLELLDVDRKKLATLSSSFPEAKTAYADRKGILAAIARADLVILAALVRGGKAPVLIKREDLRKMKKGSVIVDVAIDQGGSAEASRPTTHEHPTFIVDGVIHYCVANMPGIVPKTSTMALTAATLPHLRKLAAHGLAGLLALDPGYASLVNALGGHLTNEGVAQAWGLPYETVSLPPAL